MDLYGFSRIEGLPSTFSENKTPVTADVLEAGWIYAFCILFLSFVCILPGFKGKRKWFVLIQVTCSCLVGLILMLCNFGMEWEVAHVTTRTPYKAYSSAELGSARLGMKIGLRGVNITLYASDDHLPEELKGETIDYNERFWWSWGQGRLGFGPFAGEVQREFRRAQYRGAPLPILWIAEYFTFDGEGIRFGRHYMRAGWYAHIMIWAAFPTYLLANICYFLVLRYGAFFTAVTGMLQVVGCLIWAGVRNPVSLVIPFEDAALRTAYGVHFWLCLINGLFCLLLGSALGFMDLRYPDILSEFFGIDPLLDYEEHYYTADELEQMSHKKNSDNIELGEQPQPTLTSTSDRAETNQDDADKEPTYVVLKRRSHAPSLQKAALRQPEVAPRTRFMAKSAAIQEEPENLYENTK